MNRRVACLLALMTAVGLSRTDAADLRGRVIAVDDRTPVRRAQVRIFGAAVRTTETDADGRFNVVDLPAGVYYVQVEPVGGFVRTLSPRDVVLGERETREMTIRLERTGAIEGHVRDEHGEPVLRARVEVVRRRELGGEVLLSANGGTVTTDDRGAYRLFNLTAGDYYVVASISAYPTVGDAPPRSEAAEHWGYTPTYHPASTSRQRARIVTVRAGRDSKRIDVRLAGSPLSRVSIRTVDSNGAPLGPHAPTLVRRDEVYLDSSTYRGSRQPDGTYVFAGVAPGDYDFLAVDPQRRREVAYAKVTVAEADLSLEVKTNSGARVSGRVIVDGQPVTEVTKRPLNVGVAAFPPARKYGPPHAESTVVDVKDSDRFVLTGLRGPMVLSGNVTSGAMLSIRRAGEEIAGKTLDFDGTEAIDDVVVELTTKVAELDVDVMGTSAADAPESVVVLLFPEDARRWHPGFLAYSGLLRGAAHFIRIPAGRYLAVAIADPEFVRPLVPTVLERLRPVATAVTLNEGEKARLGLRVARVPR